MAALLHVEALQAWYGATQVLHGIDFDVPARSVTALLGANGAGKTTTLRAVCGMVKTRGAVAFDGARIDGRATEDIVRLGIAHVPDGRGTFLDLTTEENLRVGGYTRRGRHDLAADIERMYGWFPRLKERRRSRGTDLSGGEQQMLAIARALVRDPKIILLDEPFEGLAPIIVRDLLATCRALAHDGQTILIVEQNISAAMTLADRVYILRTGHVIEELTAETLRGHPEVLHRHLGV